MAGSSEGGGGPRDEPLATLGALRWLARGLLGRAESVGTGSDPNRKKRAGLPIYFRSRGTALRPPVAFRVESENFTGSHRTLGCAVIPAIARG